MSQVKGYAIDPHAKTIQEITLTKDNNGSILESLYDYIGCATVTVVSMGARVDLWLDDEGLLASDQKFFEIKQTGEVLAGKAVLLSTDGNGESISIDSRLTLEMVKKEFKFVELEKYPEPDIGIYAF